jgi:hypothetical protein
MEDALGFSWFGVLCFDVKRFAGFMAVDGEAGLCALLCGSVYRRTDACM